MSDSATSTLSASTSSSSGQVVPVAYLTQLAAALGVTAPNVRVEVAPLQRGSPVTEASLRAQQRALIEQATQAKADGEGLNDANIDRWLRQSEAAFTALAQLGPGVTTTQQAIEAAQQPLRGNAPPDDGTRATAAAFLAVLVPLQNLRNALNATPKAIREQAEQEAALKEFEDAQRAMSAAKKSSQASSSSNNATNSTSTEKDEEEDKTKSFGHKSKHRPMPGAANNEKALRAATSGKGDKAKYLASNPGEVSQLEATARQEGLTLFGGFTVIHRFDAEVGADHGEMTRCVRIDGDHGHPIIEDGPLKTSFESYLESDIAKYVSEGASNPEMAIEGLRRIRTYLEKIRETPSVWMPRKVLKGLYDKVMA